MSRDRLDLGQVTDEAFGPGFRREMELVVAANEFDSATGGGIVYDVQMQERVTHFCMPLDRGLVPRDLGVIDVRPDPSEPWREVEAATAALKGAPRGTWARLRHHAGGYDAYMSDGLGGVGTRTGVKFSAPSPTAEELTFEATYAAVLGMPIYQLRERIRREISAASFDACPDPVGMVARGVRMAGKEWSRIEVVGRSDRLSEDERKGIVAKATRPGVRTQEVGLTPSSFVALFRLPPEMPAVYADALGGARLRTLAERRGEAARAAARAAMEGVEGAAPDRHVYLRAEGDALVGRVYLRDDAPGAPSATFRADFAPGGHAVLDCRLDVPGVAPAPR